MTASSGTQSLARVDEAVEPFRHLDAGEALLSGLRIGREHAEREGEPGDVREGLAGPDGERSQHGKDLALEVRLEPLQLLVLAVRDACDLDPGPGERRPQLALPEMCLATRELEDALPDRREGLGRGEPVDGANGEPGLVQLEQAGDADHEELVEVLGEDRGELDALEEWQRQVLRDLEDPRVVLEPRELAVQQPGGSGFRADCHDVMVRERNGDSCADPVIGGDRRTLSPARAPRRRATGSAR